MDLVCGSTLSFEAMEGRKPNALKFEAMEGS